LKEDIFNILALTPLMLYVDPTLFGIFEPHADPAGFLHNMSLLWIVIGGGALLFRTVHLFILKDVQTGLVWLTKILTDPFHDIKLYHGAPLLLLRGELIDPMGSRQHCDRGCSGAYLAEGEGGQSVRSGVRSSRAGFDA
ncbi:MAG: hypothetical protein ACREYF_04190, partial [Gammaproteobacteria bacterium]